MCDLSVCVHGVFNTVQSDDLSNVVFPKHCDSASLGSARTRWSVTKPSQRDAGGTEHPQFQPSVRTVTIALRIFAGLTASVWTRRHQQSFFRACRLGLIRRICQFRVMKIMGWRVFDNLMDSDDELEFEENLLRCNSSTVPGVLFQNRFSPLVEAPIVRETVIDEGSENLHSSEAVRRPAVFPMTDDAEGELPQSPRRRRPTRRLVLVPSSTGTPQSLQYRVPSHDNVPIGHHRDEEADGSDTVSLPSQADSGFRGQGSDASGNDEFGELPVMAEVPPVRPSVAVMRRGFVALDDWDLEEVFSHRDAVCAQILMEIFPSGNQAGLG